MHWQWSHRLARLCARGLRVLSHYLDSYDGIHPLSGTEKAELKPEVPSVERARLAPEHWLRDIHRAGLDFSEGTHTVPPDLALPPEIESDLPVGFTPTIETEGTTSKSAGAEQLQTQRMQKRAVSAKPPASPPAFTCSVEIHEKQGKDPAADSAPHPMPSLGIAPPKKILHPAADCPPSNQGLSQEPNAEISLAENNPSSRPHIPILHLRSTTARRTLKKAPSRPSKLSPRPQPSPTMEDLRQSALWTSLEPPPATEGFALPQRPGASSASAASTSAATRGDPKNLRISSDHSADRNSHQEVFHVLPNSPEPHIGTPIEKGNHPRLRESLELNGLEVIPSPTPRTSFPPTPPKTFTETLRSPEASLHRSDGFETVRSERLPLREQSLRRPDALGLASSDAWNDESLPDFVLHRTLFTANRNLTLEREQQGHLWNE